MKTFKQLHEKIIHEFEGCSLISGRFLSTGFDVLDAQILGFPRGALSVISGRSSMGKTALTSGMASRLALNGKKVMLISTESGEFLQYQHLARNIIFIESGKDKNPSLGRSYQRIIGNDGLFNWELEEDLVISDSLLTYSDQKLGIDSLVEVIRQGIEQGVELFFIDSLQQIRRNGELLGYDVYNPNIKNADKIIHPLFDLAMENDISIVITSQIMYELEFRGGDRKPLFSDISWIQSYGDLVELALLIYRPSLYGITEDATGMPVDNFAKIIIGKSRYVNSPDLDIYYNNKWGVFQDKISANDFS